MATVAEGLKLSRWFEDEGKAIFLVVSTKALALCAHEGFRKLEPSRALWHFENLDRVGRAEVRAFVACTRLSSFPLCTMDDDMMFALVRRLIRSGSLVAVRRDGQGKPQAEGQTRERRRLVRKIESLVRGRLRLAGRSYKLVVDVDLAKVPRRDDYEVVRHDHAVEVLARLAAQPGAGDLPELLHEASSKLTRDWRPPMGEPDGLVLLRHVPVLAAAANETPAITPSQLAKLADEQPVTLEVVVLGLDDKPLKGLSYAIEAPDAETYEGDLGASAKTKITSARKGSAGVALKWSDDAGTST